MTRVINHLRELSARIRGVFSKKRRDDELEDEFAAHLDLLAEENIRRGMSEKDALHAARREFGGVEQIRETYRERRGLPMLETFLKDLRFGARMLRKNAAFTTIAVLTLALGIGATTSIFSVVNTLLLRPLPFPDSNRIVILQEAIPKLVPGKLSVSAPDIADFRRLSHSFEDLGGFSSNQMDLSSSGSPERVQVTRTAAAVFRILQTTPAMGRTFTEDEDQMGHDVAILSHGLWQTRFGADPAIVGKTILLNRQPYSVIGVMPKEFVFPPQGLSHFTSAQVWTPISLNPFELGDRADNFDYGVLAKLKSGVILATADSDVMVAAHQIQTQLWPEKVQDSSKWTLEASVTPLEDMVVGSTRTLLMLLLGAVGLLLLISCANVANLMLARGAERQKEIAVRIALGAGRMRVVRQLLVESSLLGVLGGSLGLFVAYAGMKELVVLAERVLPRTQEVGLDHTVLLFTLVISIASGILFGIVPALAATKTDLNKSLKDAGRTKSDARGNRRLHDAFVVTQIALSLVLVVGSGLLIRSFIRARDTDPGFRPENTIGLSVSLNGPQYRELSQMQSFFDRLSAQMRAFPGVSSVGISTDLPLNSGWTHGFTGEGHETDQRNSMPIDFHTLVDGDYFQTMGIPLIRGRFFNDAEMHGKGDAVIISDGMAKRYWPNEDPIGRRLKWGAVESMSPWLTIVGVVGDIKQGPLDAATRPHTYETFQHMCVDPHIPMCSGRFVMVRSEALSNVVVPAARNIIQQMDPQQPIGKVFVMNQIISNSLAPRRFNTWLLAAFGFGALLLAAIGVYGVISYSVSQRTRELGVRLALGAQPADILRLVLRKGLVLAAIGLVIGIGASLAATRLMSSLLYNVSATDPLTFAAVGALLVVVALAACWIPARRAMRTDPAVTLRYE
jgi:putative ABC transport system permease protein